MNNNDNRTPESIPASSPTSERKEKFIWQCPVCNISCDDRFCPMCGISREVAIAFAGAAPSSEGSDPFAGIQQSDDWPSVSASAEKNELYRQRISDSEAMKGLTGMFDIVKPEADTQPQPEHPSDGASLIQPQETRRENPEDIPEPIALRRKERTQPIPGDSPVDIAAELETLTARQRYESPKIEFSERREYVPYVRPKREKTKLPRTSAASPEPLLPPELTPVFDDLPSTPITDETELPQQPAPAADYRPVQPQREEIRDIPEQSTYAQSRDPFENVGYQPAADDGQVRKYDTSSQPAVRGSMKAARRAEAQDGKISRPEPQVQPDTDGRTGVVYVETGDKAGLWKPVGLIGIILSALLLLALAFVYVKYALLIPKYGDAAKGFGIIDVLTGHAVPAKSGDASDTDDSAVTGIAEDVLTVPVTEEQPAEETAPDETFVEEQHADQTEPVTEGPYTEAPVTEEPSTEAPVTEAPETEEPETEAQETAEPETAAEQETASPETTAPETEAETSAEDVTTAETTEAPQETAVPEAETSPVETEPEPETAPEAYDINEEAVNG